MHSRRSAIAASVFTQLMLLAVSGCSRGPGMAAPETPPQLPRTADTAQPEDDQESARKFEALVRGFGCFHSHPEDTVIILWPTAEDFPPQMRPQAEEAGPR